MKASLVKQPIAMIVLVNVLAFLLLFFYRFPLNYQTLYIGGCILILTIMTYGAIIFFRLGDEYLFLISSMLVTIGMVMLCRLNYLLGIAQVGWYLIGICAFYGAYFIYRYINFWDKLKWLYLGVSVILYILTQAIGVTINGAKNWILILGYTVQPVEVIKIFYILFLAARFTGNNKQLLKLPQNLTTGLFVFVFVVFLLLQREWGLMLLFFFTYIALLYIYDDNKLFLALNIFVCCVVGTVGAYTMRHIAIRISTWKNPWDDITNTGYQITQSLFAIASGGFFGRGIGLGRPDFIPAANSDFIFSAICEELGIFGGAAIILLYLIFVYRGIKIAILLPEGFDKAVSLGITIMFAFQAFIIIGGVIKLIPLTGITLPFISSGGSSLISSFISLGMLQAISAKERKMGSIDKQ
ncbi:MAG: FtsW/RodA/SpoVE family cell cycle protein [Clostridiaceae bacterium]|nr:FtsW/RodA/SpoVE family cell cycle protein [Clostridiaceae bacterium]